MGLQLGLLKQRTPMSELMDRDFFPKQIQPARIDMSKLPEVEKTLNTK
jgi:hypothetical protein